MSYVVQLEAFSGPLDLLLHLIHKNEVAIYDIPIARITDQYLEHLQRMQSCDVEVASEFIVMAATLMEIKSRTLLPPAPREESAEDGTDPRAELVQMLEEYRRYKDAAEALRFRWEVWSRVFLRGGDLPVDAAALAPDLEFANLSVPALVEALREVLLAAEDDHGAPAIQRQKVTVRMKLAELRRRLCASPEGVVFQELFERPYTRAEVVATFLAVLELLRLGRIHVAQQQAFGGLRIWRAAGFVWGGDG